MELEYNKKKFFNFFMVHKYHGKLDFTNLEYSKSGKSLYISKTVVDCNIVYENLLFGYFHQKNGRQNPE